MESNHLQPWDGTGDAGLHKDSPKEGIGFMTHSVTVTKQYPMWNSQAEKQILIISIIV